MKKLVSLLLVAVMSLSLMACGKTVESALESPANQTAINDLKGEIVDAYGSGSSCDVYGKGNDLYFEISFGPSFTEDQLELIKSSIDMSRPYVEEQIDGLKTQFEKEEGVKPSTIIYVYKDSEGNVLGEISK